MRAVNLIPGDQRKSGSVGSGRSEGAAYAVLTLLAVIALLALLYGKDSRAVSSNKSKAATITAEAQAAQARASALAPYTSFVSLREQRAQAVAALVDTRFDWAHAFHEFGRVLSGQTSITGLTGTIVPAGEESSTAAAAAAAKPSATVSSATPAGSVPTFQLAGCAKSQRAVADMLQRLRLIDGVAEVTLQSSTKGSTAAGATSNSGGCPSTAPVFAVTVSFDPLPSASASAAAAGAKQTTVAASSSTASTSTSSSAASTSTSGGGNN